MLVDCPTLNWVGGGKGNAIFLPVYEYEIGTDAPTKKP